VGADRPEGHGISCVGKEGGGDKWESEVGDVSVHPICRWGSFVYLYLW
jgi:hypothetical protein